MKLDGRDIADKIYQHLKQRVGELQKRNIIPHLVVILVGKNPASLAYIVQKQKSGENIGAKVTVLSFKENTTTEELEEKIKLLNNDPFVNGILMQRPLPSHIDSYRLEEVTDPQKDIDGFHKDSPYTLPLPLAVEKILEEIYLSLREVRDERQISDNFNNWLKSQNIVILGKGKIGGEPIISYIKTIGVLPIVIDSKTTNREDKLKQADIIISAVGKKVINPECLKPGVILIGVGLYKDAEGSLQGDYDEEAIKNIASFYTPTPKGVGPVNVAMLMDNLITATERQTQ